MGRKSPTKKREKRLRQKMKKKSLKCTSSSESSGTIGPLNSPPPSSEFFNSKFLSPEDSKLFGIDETIFTYQEDDKNDFALDNGKRLTGIQLQEHLRKYNRTLAERAKIYQRKYEDTEYLMYQKEAEYMERIRKVREFYRDVLYYSSRHSSVMLKTALGKRV